MKTYIGIDWSEKKHDVVYLNEEGIVIGQMEIKHSAGGLLKLEEMREKMGLRIKECYVGLETAHNIVIDFLWERGYKQVYVVPPSVIKSCRGRYGQSRARNDKKDGRLIADVVRTDRARLYPWKPDSVLTRQIRGRVSLIKYLTRKKVSEMNRLRAILLRYYPVALEVFGGIETQISLKFIKTYNTPQQAEGLSWEEFERFTKVEGYRRGARVRACFARLQQRQFWVNPDTVAVYQDEAPVLATSLLETIKLKNRTLKQLQHLFEAHPDHLIFASLPGAGQLLAPSLLAKFGDDRHRFPSPACVQALAGTCPVTDASGKRKVIRFRRACDRDFRQICQQWARLSLRKSVWANAYWQQVRPRCTTHNHAYRCIANRWLGVLWKMWQTKRVYDEAYHLRQRALRGRAR